MVKVEKENACFFISDKDNLSVVAHTNELADDSPIKIVKDVVPRNLSNGHPKSMSNTLLFCSQSEELATELK